MWLAGQQTDSSSDAALSIAKMRLWCNLGTNPMQPQPKRCTDQGQPLTLRIDEYIASGCGQKKGYGANMHSAVQYDHIEMMSYSCLSSMQGSCDMAGTLKSAFV